MFIKTVNGNMKIIGHILLTNVADAKNLVDDCRVAAQIHYSSYIRTTVGLTVRRLRLAVPSRTQCELGTSNKLLYLHNT